MSIVGNAVWEDPTSSRRALHGKGQFPVISETEVDTESVNPVWRLGEPHPKAKQLLLRIATTGDVKKPGAASRSLYYQTHGNPKVNRKKKRKEKGNWSEENKLGEDMSLIERDKELGMEQKDLR